MKEFDYILYFDVRSQQESAILFSIIIIDIYLNPGQKSDLYIVGVSLTFSTEAQLIHHKDKDGNWYIYLECLVH